MAGIISPPKPSDDQFPIPNCFQPKLQNSVSDDCHDQIASHHSVPIWLHGLIGSQMKSNPNAAAQLLATSSSAAAAAAAGPDLELKLAGPRPNSEKNKSSQGHLFVGTITVT